MSTPNEVKLLNLPPPKSYETCSAHKSLNHVERLLYDYVCSRILIKNALNRGRLCWCYSHICIYFPWTYIKCKFTLACLVKQFPLQFFLATEGIVLDYHDFENTTVLPWIFGLISQESSTNETIAPCSFLLSSRRK